MNIKTTLDYYIHNNMTMENTIRLQIFQAIQSLLNRISDSIIDSSKSIMQSISNGMSFTLISNSGEKCPVILTVSDSNIIDIFVGFRGEYLFNQPINNSDDVNKLHATMIDLFFGSIEETLVFKGTKLVKAGYLIHYIENNERKTYEFGVHYKNTLFNFGLKKISKTYSPWI